LTDLIEKLTEAATIAIRAREAAITTGAGNLRSVHVELEINGAEIVTTTYLEWRQVVRRAK
jgi:hypothetical protein